MLAQPSLAALLMADDFADQSLSLFNGQNLQGWEGNAAWFRVEDGAIVAGRLDQRIPHNEFLCTTQNYDNFDLRLEAKLIGNGNNAGVQFRSLRVPHSSEVAGYQADLGMMLHRNLWGALYDESRRRKMLAETDPSLVQQIFKSDDWNELRIVCRGPRIQIYLNGRQTVDYTEADSEIRPYGVIGLQIHSGRPSEAWYRNLRIQQLPLANED
jgi:hypothetical protein